MKKPLAFVSQAQFEMGFGGGKYNWICSLTNVSQRAEEVTDMIFIRDIQMNSEIYQSFFHYYIR